MDYAHQNQNQDLLTKVYENEHENDCSQVDKTKGIEVQPERAASTKISVPGGSVQILKQNIRNTVTSSILSGLSQYKRQNNNLTIYLPDGYQNHG